MDGPDPDRAEEPDRPEPAPVSGWARVPAALRAMGTVDRTSLLPVLGGFLCLLFVVSYVGVVGVEPDGTSDFLEARVAEAAPVDEPPETSDVGEAARDGDEEEPDAAASSKRDPEASTGRQFRAQSLWGLAALAYLLAMAGVLLASTWIVREASREGWKDAKVGLAWVVLAFSPLLFPVLQGWGFFLGTGKSVGLGGYLRTIGDVRDDVDNLTWIGNLLTAVALAMTLLAIQAVVRTLPERTSSKKARWVETMRGRVRRFNALLAAASFMMTTAVLEVYALYSWPRATLRAEYLQSAGLVAQTMTLIAGVLFTLYLVAVFLPSGWVLQHRIATLAERQWPEESSQERTQRLLGEGLQLTMPVRVTTALKALAPLLVGTGVAEAIEVLVR